MWNGLRQPDSSPLPAPSAADLEPAGHAMVIVGWNRTERAVLLRNSGGATWAEAGHLWVSSELIPLLTSAWVVDEPLTTSRPAPRPVRRDPQGGVLMDLISYQQQAARTDQRPLTGAPSGRADAAIVIPLLGIGGNLARCKRRTRSSYVTARPISPSGSTSVTSWATSSGMSPI